MTDLLLGIAYLVACVAAGLALAADVLIVLVGAAIVGVVLLAVELVRGVW